MRILVVDDNADAVEMTAQWLELAGQSVYLAFGGRQANCLCSNREARCNPY
jgi:CheY-like chemotaxis protein